MEQKLVSKAVTRGVEVTVRSFFLEEQSDPDQQVFTFAYHVRLENHGTETVQLLRRHWVITDSNGEVRHVEGEGVVGEQPVLPPGQHFEYVSGSRLRSPMGTMQGNYQMRTESGELFDAEIPLFMLTAPSMIN